MQLTIGVQENKISLKSLSSLIILALLLISVLDFYFDGLRYAKYGIPPICLLVFLADKGRISTDRTTRPFLLLSVVTLLMAPLGNAYGLHDFYFYLTALSPFLVGCVPNLTPRALFKLLAVFFGVISIPEVVGGGFDFSIIDSRSTLENNSFAFVFGLFCIFFFLAKDKKYFFFSLILAILVLKRISLLALGLIIAIYYLVPFVLLKRVAIAGLAVNIVYLFVAYYITTDSFNYFVQSHFDVSSSYLTMGRTVLYDPIFSADRSFIALLFGDGPGDSYNIAAASIFVVKGKVNLHSDVLKIYYELGILVFLAFFFLCYKLRDLRIYLFIYINIILFTDNVSTYVIVMYVYFFLAQKLREYDSNAAAKSGVLNR